MCSCFAGHVCAEEKKGSMCCRIWLNVLSWFLFSEFNIKGKPIWLRRSIIWLLILKSKVNGRKHNQMCCSHEVYYQHQCVLAVETFHVPQSRVLHYWFWVHPVPLWLMIHTVWLKWHIHCGAARITYSSKSFWQVWTWLYASSCFVKASQVLKMCFMTMQWGIWRLVFGKSDLFSIP